MPELPEVEIVRRGLDREITGMRVTKVQIRRADVVFFGSTKARGLNDRLLLKDRTIDGTRRHGKYMAIVSRDGAAVMVHLGMTGSLTAHASPPGTIDRHVHVVWTLRREGVEKQLVFRDPRRFGFLEAFDTAEDLDRALEHLGPDALNISAAQLERALRGRRTPVKAALLNQRLLAGVGNIYADEALFRARVHPARLSKTLSTGEVRILASAVRKVLRLAIARGGSSIRDYRDTAGRIGEFQHKHLVYGRAGKPCAICGNALEHARIGQRTSTFCDRCQPRG